MKTFKNILTILGLGAWILTSCSDEWDKHYSQQEQEIDSDILTVVDADLLDYITTTAEYSAMVDLWERTGVMDSIKTREQVFTMLAVNNSLLQEELDDEKYTALSLVSDLAFSPANMVDGQRILMWNGKYLNITIDENGTIAFNEAEAVKIVKLNDGYLYELSSIPYCPKSLYEFIRDLGDEYSMFRDSVLARNVEEFDRENSIPNGVDATGNTTYDTVWRLKNYVFEEVGLNILSEAISATVLVPSNDVVLASWAEAEARMKKWKLTDIPESLPDSVAKNWFFKVAFFNRDNTPLSAFFGEDDVKSVFDSTDAKIGIRHRWRPSVQRADFDNPVELSNAVVYYVEKLQTPVNVLIWRLKEYFWNYNSLSEADKARLYKFENLSEEGSEVVGTSWANVAYQPWMAGATRDTKTYEDGTFNCIYIRHNVVKVSYTDEFEDYMFAYEIKPYHFHRENNEAVAIEYLIPPGTYNFGIGMQEKMRYGATLTINDKVMKTFSAADNNWSAHHFDRSSNGKYPYGYTGSDSKWGRDGGATTTITFTEEEGTPITIRLKCIDFPNVTTNKPVSSVRMYCWTLTPTDDCY